MQTEQGRRAAGALTDPCLRHLYAACCFLCRKKSAVNVLRGDRARSAGPAEPLGHAVAVWRADLFTHRQAPESPGRTWFAGLGDIADQ